MPKTGSGWWPVGMRYSPSVSRYPTMMMRRWLFWRTAAGHYKKGDRASAYRVLHQRFLNYCQEHGVVRAIVKESAVNPRGGTTKGHLEAAEVRGVVISAAAAIATTEVFVAKAKVSKTFGSRKADEYLKDSDFWTDHVDGALRVGSREAVLVLRSQETQNDEQPAVEPCPGWSSWSRLFRGGLARR